YARDEITIDLVALCAPRKVRFVAGRVTGLDPLAHLVRFDGRPPLAYDVLSLGVGSLPACPEHCAADERSILMRPLGALLNRLERIDADLAESPRPLHLAVVGGGASGCELALAVHKRLAKHPGFRLTLL